MLLDPKWIKVASLVTGAGTVKGLLIVGGYLLGSYLDERWATPPVFTMIGIVVGLILGICWILVVIKRVKW